MAHKPPVSAESTFVATGQRALGKKPTAGRLAELLYQMAMRTNTTPEAINPSAISALYAQYRASGQISKAQLHCASTLAWVDLDSESMCALGHAGIIPYCKGTEPSKQDQVDSVLYGWPSIIQEFVRVHANTRGASLAMLSHSQPSEWGLGFQCHTYSLTLAGVALKTSLTPISKGATQSTPCPSCNKGIVAQGFAGVGTKAQTLALHAFYCQFTTPQYTVTLAQIPPRLQPLSEQYGQCPVCKAPVHKAAVSSHTELCAHIYLNIPDQPLPGFAQIVCPKCPTARYMPIPSSETPLGHTPKSVASESQTMWKELVDTHTRAHNYPAKPPNTPAGTTAVKYGCDLRNMLTNISPNTIIGDMTPVQSKIRSVTITQSSGQSVVYDTQTLLTAVRAELTSHTVQRVIGHYSDGDPTPADSTSLTHQALTALFGGKYAAFKENAGDPLTAELIQYYPTDIGQALVKGNNIPTKKVSGAPNKRKRTQTPKPTPTPRITRSQSTRHLQVQTQILRVMWLKKQMLKESQSTLAKKGKHCYIPQK